MDERNKNDPNISTQIDKSCPQTLLSRNYPITENNKSSNDRRTRVHKHSLQQGNKWKLLQQKVLGNLDEEKDDEQEVPAKHTCGKI